MSDVLVIKEKTLNEHGIATTRFREEYQCLTGYNSKRLKMTKVIRCGQIIEAAGLDNLLAVIDTEEFFAADKSTRQDMVKRVLSLSYMSPPSSSPAETKMTSVEIATATPPAEEKAQIQAESPANNGTDTSSEDTTSITKNEDGSTTIIERPTNQKSLPSALAALKRGGIAKG
ncbi:hypothetical protein KKI95_14195 [Xenorhabdus bovienii]|uniref:hypothetical protein n=1 Tax=Xenorhabdus bovienii TaxID=40576 RepID=UPI0023B25998|nr:hypothetical protein [Xenorhabdus bovienii]MDE9437045.1 hypothetical protein [Xenorhabdus bovienii]MDE9467103.1 hypothetical protein [Xenorhabdus bovienii]MDE9498688.1 hypothetical protein [Xenorhabdus bovienii]